MMTNDVPSPEPYLLALRRAEDETFERSLMLLGNTSNLIQDLSLAFEAVVAEVSRTIDTSQSEHQTKIVYLMLTNARYQVLAGALSLLRGHASDSKSYIRKVLETGLFALTILERPAATAAWLHADSDWNTYRKEFRIMHMLDKGKHPNLSPLERAHYEKIVDYYERFSKEVHATALATIRNVAFVPDGKSMRVGMSLVDSMEDSELELVFSFLELVANGNLILGFFAQLFERLIPAFDAKSALASSDQLSIQVKSHFAKWDSTH